MTEQDTSRKGSAVAGLAREVETLRRRMDRAASADDVVRLADALTELEGSISRPTKVAETASTWLDLPNSPAEAQALLGDLTNWLTDVYLRYLDGAKGLPECWLWHAEIVEELVWLMGAWYDAYGETGSVKAAGDWHDRLRPGVVRRISEAYAKSCSLENHLPARAVGSPIVPVAEAVDAVVTWWTQNRDQPGPAPTDDQMTTAATAARRARRGGALGNE